MLLIMLLAAAVMLFMILDWLWFDWVFGRHMDRFWSVMAFISAAAGYTFSGDNEGDEWTIIIGIFMYVAAGVIIIVGIGKRVSRNT